jgi:hypothetical protein
VADKYLSGLVDRYDKAMWKPEIIAHKCLEYAVESLFNITWFKFSVI